ncbi:MAG: copper chaperone PCu(A)C [Azoarcus sp.]|jgi:copper(I)-binding protein|nr:copper chaperone PCu(A)C [Azoarcus sp.]
MTILRLPAMFTALFLAMPIARAETGVADPWVRATVPQQKATGAFMKITSPVDARLVGVRSPLAGTAEIHEMRMEGDKMKMRAVAALPLPAATSVELEPGGWHIMLLDLAAQVKEGDTVPIALTIETADGKRETLHIDAPARPLHGGSRQRPLRSLPEEDGK